MPGVHLRELATLRNVNFELGLTGNHVVVVVYPRAVLLASRLSCHLYPTKTKQLPTYISPVLLSAPSFYQLARSARESLLFTKIVFATGGTQSALCAWGQPELE